MELRGDLGHSVLVDQREDRCLDRATLGWNFMNTLLALSSSGVNASHRIASVPRLSPAEGSMTCGAYRSFRC